MSLCTVPSAAAALPLRQLVRWAEEVIARFVCLTLGSANSGIVHADALIPALCYVVMEQSNRVRAML